MPLALRHSLPALRPQGTSGLRWSVRRANGCVTARERVEIANVQARLNELLRDLAEMNLVIEIHE